MLLPLSLRLPDAMLCAERYADADAAASCRHISLRLRAAAAMIRCQRCLFRRRLLTCCRLFFAAAAAMLP